MGFGVPVFHWLRHDLRYYADEYMNETEFARHGLFRQEGVNHIMQRFLQATEITTACSGTCLCSRCGIRNG